ncbi:MAG: HAD family phosphatase [Coriobacteriales bacterium]|nr:HAD family phosphatase [Coriobacteriales bacterium]
MGTTQDDALEAQARRIERLAAAMPDDEALPDAEPSVRTAPMGLWPPDFDAAIFDFDGTISDTASLWHEIDLAFLGERGLPYSADYPQKLNVLGFEAGARYTIERYGLHEAPEDICNEWNLMGRALYRSRATLRDGAQGYIEALRGRGVGIALATTNDPDVLDSMRHVDVNRLFDVRVHGKEVARQKDHPDIYLEAARRLGVEPGRCIVFEDIVPGLLSARRAGMCACGVYSNDPVQNVAEVRRVADRFLWEWTDIRLDTTR